jgi:hypothetical protein
MMRRLLRLRWWMLVNGMDKWRWDTVWARFPTFASIRSLGWVTSCPDRGTALSFRNRSNTLIIDLIFNHELSTRRCGSLTRSPNNIMSVVACVHYNGRSVGGHGVGGDKLT